MQKRKFKRRIKPIVPRCVRCKNGKVLHHHNLCDRCWILVHLSREYKYQSGRR